MEIFIHRIYDATHPGYSGCRRILIDKLWPRGISKQHAGIDYWAKDIAPSHELRKWYKHDHEKWDEFRTRYHVELDANPIGLSALLAHMGDEKVIFLFGSKELRYNNAFALMEYLELRV